MPSSASDLWTIARAGYSADLRWVEVAADLGLRPSRGRVDCVGALLGQRCREWPERRAGDPCVCRPLREEFGSINDHARRWIDAEGRPVLTLETYVPEGSRLDAFRAYCAAHGLTVETGERSPHLPGETLLLIVRPAQ
ncbi:hypothetical protein [Geodermatophilus chilensis]|uniref:hypothetical protein n=1 Tax=Geodermatophilus chilensis TaxID=2035835 RepID=UPI000C265501|nr:hypothetical protein [Geodermatophilus chilensis]